MFFHHPSDNSKSEWSVWSVWGVNLGAVPSGILHTGSNHACIGWHAWYQPAQALGIVAASALSLGQTIQSIFTDEIMTNGDSNIARSWKCINGLFTACG